MARSGVESAESREPLVNARLKPNWPEPQRNEPPKVFGRKSRMSRAEAKEWRAFDPARRWAAKLRRLVVFWLGWRAPHAGINRSTSMRGAS